MAVKPKSPPPEAVLTRVRHTVNFYETDAMGIVHHSNYVRFFEHARVQFLAEHDRPYTEYVAEGLHVPVTRVAVSYKRPCRFADEIEITCWLAWAREASLGFAYELKVGDLVVTTGETDHAIVNLDNRPTRIPQHMRVHLDRWLGKQPTREAGGQ
jgi:acyl-CoA thioester hydrolase